MMRLGLLALTLVALGVEPAAAGESCGGSSSSSSSDSSSDSSSSSSSAPACVEVSDVHGYRQCTGFGKWSTAHRPAILVELGTAMRSFASPLGERTGSLSHGTESFSYRVVGPSAGPSVALDTAVVAQLRVGAAFRHGFFVAAEGEVGALTDGGGGSAEMTSTGELGSPDIEKTSVTIASGLAAAGVRLRLGPLSLGAEAAGGFRTLTYNYESHYHACVETAAITTVMPVLEGRARAAVWVSPFMTVGATYGKSLIDEAWVGGIYVGGNTRAFGGH